jgi:hypothetical protein
MVPTSTVVAQVWISIAYQIVREIQNVGVGDREYCRQEPQYWRGVLVLIYGVAGWSKK